MKKMKPSKRIEQIRWEAEEVLGKRDVHEMYIQSIITYLDESDKSKQENI